MLPTDTKFIEFVESLPNMEKTRNFYSLKGYSLKPFEEFLKKIEFNFRPKKRFSIVGTNGKGSLAHYLSLILKYNYSVGVYTSPHLIHALERIQINGQSVQEYELDSILKSLSKETRSRLTEFSYFEIFTLFCLLVFDKKKLDFEIWEAGLGGRLDATKLVNADTVILTKIDLDHLQILGSTKEKILLEKLGICGSFTKNIYALDPMNAALKEILLDFCKQNSIALEIFPKEIKSNNYLQTSYEFAKYIIAKESIPIDQSIQEADWDFFSKPLGRLEVINDSPLLIYDTAHNPGACSNLIADLARIYPGIVWDCVVSILPHKDVEGIISLLQNFENTDKIYSTIFAPFSIEKTKNTIPVLNENEWIKLISNNQKKLRPTLVCGSFRVYKLLKEIFIDK